MDEDKKILKKLASQIVALRKKKKLSQTELGHLCDLDRQAMWRIEKGTSNPTTLTLIKISRALEVPLKKLVDFKY